MNELIWWIVIILLLAVALVAMCFPVQLIRLMRIGSRGINSSNAFCISKPLFFERLIYKNHRLVGFLVWLLSCATLYFLVFHHDLTALIQRADSNPFGLQGWLFESFITLALVVAVIGCCIGIILLMRPSVLKTLEAWGNRWMSTPERWLDKNIPGQALEAWVTQHTRLFGLLVFLSASVIWILVFGLD